MGANDYSLFYYGEIDQENLSHPIFDLRLVKLYRILRERIDRSLYCSFDESDVIQNEYRKLIFEWVEISKSKSPEEVIALLSDRIPKKKDLARVLAAIYQERQVQENFTGKNMPSHKLIAKAFELYPRHHSIAFWLFGQLSAEECQSYAEEIFECGPNVPDDLITQYLQCSEKDSKTSRLAAKRLRLKMSQSLREASRQNYQDLHKLLVKEGIIHLAMQYPTVPIAELQAYFSDSNGKLLEEFKNLRFISNEENFKLGLRDLGYDKVFVDRFKNSWGHTAELGHQMIADQVFLELRGVLEGLKIGK